MITVQNTHKRAPFVGILEPGGDYGSDPRCAAHKSTRRVAVELPDGSQAVKLVDELRPAAITLQPGESLSGLPDAVADAPDFRAGLQAGTLKITRKLPPEEDTRSMTSLPLSPKIIIEEEEPQFRPIAGRPTAVIGLVGITEKGPIGKAVLCTSPEDYRRVFGGYVAAGEVAQAVDGIFNAAGPGASVHVVRTVHYSDPSTPGTKTSAAAALTLLTAALAAVAGSVLSTNSAPFNLTPGDTLDVAIDGGGASTATFNATAASRTSANGPFALSNGQTLTVAIDGGAVQTIAFLTGEFVAIGAATAAEVAAVINAKGSGLNATVSGSAVVLASDKKGTASAVNVTGGTANGALGFTTGSTAGTGNVANIDAVTAAEVKTIVEAAVAGCTVTDIAGQVRIASNTLGASSSVLVQASSSADDEIGFDNATHSGTNAGTLNTLAIAAKYDGAFGNSLSVKVDPASSGDSTRFNLQVLRAGVVLETWPNLSMSDTDPNFVETVINNESTGSAWIAATDLDAATTAPNDKPAAGTFGPLTGGGDGLAGLADTDFLGAEGTAGARTGLRALDLVADLSLLAIPGRATPAVHAGMVAYCETTRDLAVFAVLDPPAGYSASQIKTYVESTAALLNLSEFGGIYWPRVKVLNPAKSVFGNTDQITAAPSGRVLGAMARTDAQREGGVFDAPAGIEKGILSDVLGFETDECLDERKRDQLYPSRINVLTTSPGQPRYIDGSRTLKGGGNFPSVSERRGVIFIEQSIKDGLLFAKHKNNDAALRAQCTRVVTVFLTGLMNLGAFRSRDPKTAFFVDFGEALNPPAQVFAGKLRGRVGLATQKPAEFVTVSFSQDTRSIALGAPHGREGSTEEVS